MSRAADRVGASARRLARVALAGGLAIVAAVVLEQQARDAIETHGKGLDFAPLRQAAHALLHGASIYGSGRFVYPPTAALALAPTTLGGAHATLDVWLVLSAIAVGAAALLALRPWQRGWWPALAALAACALLRSDALTDTLWLGNLTLLLAPVAVGVMLLFESEHWGAGVALLVLSILVKPLLAPLLLVPLLSGEWRALAAGIAAGAVALALAILVVPGGGHFFAVIGHLEGGSSLRGSEAVYNVSLRGLGERLGLGDWASAARAVAVAASVVVAARWVRRPPAPGGAAAIGTLALLVFMLAGSLSEDHYLLVAAACTLAMLACAGDPLATLVALPGLVLVVAPRHWLGGVAGSAADLQVRWVLAQVLLAAAATFVALAPGARRHRPRARAYSTNGTSIFVRSR